MPSAKSTETFHLRRLLKVPPPCCPFPFPLVALLRTTLVVDIPRGKLIVSRPSGAGGAFIAAVI